MTKQILQASCFVLLFLSVNRSVQGQIDPTTIPRVANFYPGYCGWCSIEMEARRLGYVELKGLVSYRAKHHLESSSSEPDIETLLKSYQLSYAMQDHGVKDTDILFKAEKASRGCIVSLTGWPDVNGTHAVLLTFIDDEEVDFIDPNHVDQTTKTTRKWFDQYWNGFALYFLP